MVDFLRTSLQASAIGGIFVVWAKITIEAFKLSWEIATLKEETWEPVVLKRMAMCEKCNSPYFSDEVEIALCDSCANDLLEK